MKFEIKNRWTGEALFTCELSAEVAGKSYGVQLGFAVKKAVEARANLSDANLSDAYLSDANLSDANLSGANLSGANLSRADLSRADLSRANLSDANLSDANLSGAYLSRANLSDAYLSGANLSRADLSGAYLSRADLSRAYLSGVKNAEWSIAVTRILPEGSIIGWKKLKNGVLAKLLIPAEARRSHAFGRKCRAEYVDVLEVIGAEVGVSKHDGKTKYTAGQRVHPDKFDENWQQECAGGIHFFITREEAEAY